MSGEPNQIVFIIFNLRFPFHTTHANASFSAFPPRLCGGRFFTALCRSPSCRFFAVRFCVFAASGALKRRKERSATPPFVLTTPGGAGLNVDGPLNRERRPRSLAPASPRKTSGNDICIEIYRRIQMNRSFLLLLLLSLTHGSPLRVEDPLSARRNEATLHTGGEQRFLA